MRCENNQTAQHDIIWKKHFLLLNRKEPIVIIVSSFFFPNNMVFGEWKQSSHFLLCFPFLTLPQTEADTQKQTDALKLRCRNGGEEIVHLGCCIILSFCVHFLFSLFWFLVLPLCGFFSPPNALLLPAFFFSGVYIYFLSSVSCLLSSFHPSLISLPSSRTRQRQRSVSRQRT